jgi:hypothetical protein
VRLLYSQKAPRYLSNDGDGSTVTTSVIFIMGGGGSGDWSDPIPFQGPQGPAGDTGSAGAPGADGADGSDGADGASAYVYIAYASDDEGTGFTTTFNAALDYIAIKSTATPIASPSASDFAGLWKNYKGQKGDTGDTGSTGSPGADGSDGTDGADGALWFVGSTDPDNGTGADGDLYIQVGVGSTGIVGDVWQKSAETWSILGNIRGPAGAGTGDMLASVYDPTGKSADAFNTDNRRRAGEGRSIRRRW